MPLKNAPPCPDSLKPIQHYLTIATEHDSRDPVVSYWCRMYAVQQGMKLDKSSPEAKALLVFLMNWLEEAKAKESNNEAVIHDIPGQAHVENYALKLFLWADGQDRAGIFNKNVVKAFYTAGMLFSVLETFGELTEEVLQNQKYAKWKAAYIHNCLKNGQTPVPGPMAGEDDENQDNSLGFVQPKPSPSEPGSSHRNLSPTMPTIPNYSDVYPVTPMSTESPAPISAPPATPQPYLFPAGGEDPIKDSTATAGGVPLPPELIVKAQKFCKFAGSALNYDDVPTAIANLKKALSILTIGREE